MTGKIARISKPQLAVALAVGATFFTSLSAEARLGGGEGFDGGGGGGGGSGGGGYGGGGAGDIGDMLVLLFRLIAFAIEVPVLGVPLLIGLVVGVTLWLGSESKNARRGYSSRHRAHTRRWRSLTAFGERLRRYDPNFSEPAFLDFAYALYARVHGARADIGALRNLTTFVSVAGQRSIERISTPPDAIEGVIVGGLEVLALRDPAVYRDVSITLRFRTNLTERRGPEARALYHLEEWTLWRARGVLSLAPEALRALSCPSCGSPTELRSDGSCSYCDAVSTGPEQGWQLGSVKIVERSRRRPPTDAPAVERGTRSPDVVSPSLRKGKESFLERNPDETWETVTRAFSGRFLRLQRSWSERDTGALRSATSDRLFSSLRFWLEQYDGEGRRNVLSDIALTRVRIVKVSADRFYESITARIFARMIDVTYDRAGNRVAGSADVPRLFSEYWTFIRRLGARPHSHGDQACPSCGAPLKVSQSGVCGHCESKVTDGNFDWVLSRIEQDEVYGG